MLMHKNAQAKQIYSRGVVCACLEQCVCQVTFIWLLIGQGLTGVEKKIMHHFKAAL